MKKKTKTMTIAKTRKIVIGATVRWTNGLTLDCRTFEYTGTIIAIKNGWCEILPCGETRTVKVRKSRLIPCKRIAPVRLREIGAIK